MRRKLRTPNDKLKAPSSIPARLNFSTERDTLLSGVLIACALLLLDVIVDLAPAVLAGILFSAGLSQRFYDTATSSVILKELQSHNHKIE